MASRHPIKIPQETVSERAGSLNRLVGEGLLRTEPYRPVELTVKGKRLADESRERHEIVHDFLLAIGVDQATAALDAEGIEHHVSCKKLACLQDATRRLRR